MITEQVSMQKQRFAKITGTGIGIPPNTLSNQDLEKIVDTSDEWIRSRTGIENRFIASDDQTTSDLASEAAENALKDAGLSASQVDMIILATITPDFGFPSTAVMVQKNIGAHNAAAFDISAACTGFIYGLQMADSLIKAGKAETILVLGAEMLSRLTDYTDRNTCVLFGDGSGAVVVQATDKAGTGILATDIYSDGRLHNLLRVDGLGVKNPPSHESVDAKLHYIKMEGREVFKYAVTSMGDAAEAIIKAANLTSDDVNLLISHQANIRIIDATAKRIHIPPEKVFVNVHKYGNTSAASIPIAIYEARQQGRLTAGSTAILVAFGGGLTWGAAAVRF